MEEGFYSKQGGGITTVHVQNNLLNPGGLNILEDIK